MVTTLRKFRHLGFAKLHDIEKELDIWSCTKCLEIFHAVKNKRNCELKCARCGEKSWTDPFEEKYIGK